MSHQTMLTWEEAVGLAGNASAQGDYQTAVHLLRQIHAHVPDNLEVLRALGISLVNAGDLEAALPLMHLLAQRQCNLQNILDFLRLLRALRRIPDMDLVCGVAWPHVGDDPEFLGIWAYANLQMSHFDKAIELLQRALGLAPDDTGLLHNLSAALIRSGRGEEAVAVFRRLALPWGGGAKAPRNFVEEYAGLAAGYDDNSLHQYFSEKLLSIQERIRPGHFGGVLELGCGSGLLAAHLVDVPDKFIGIDISPHMLELAARRGRYSALICGDIVGEIQKLEEMFGSVLSAGVLCYLADLRPVFSNVARLLVPGGIFAFSVDPSTDDMDIGGTNPGEYCHSRKYLRGLAADVGLEERMIDIDVHRGPPGFWCVFQKP